MREAKYISDDFGMRAAPSLQNALQNTIVFDVLPTFMFFVMFASPWGYGSMVPHWTSKYVYIYIYIYINPIEIIMYGVTSGSSSRVEVTLRQSIRKTAELRSKDCL